MPAKPVRVWERWRSARRCWHVTRLTLDTRACIRLGAAHAPRRTLAAGILPSARSMLSPLRHPGFAEKATPAPGHGQPLAATSPSSTGFQPVCLPGSYWAHGIIACMCDSRRGAAGAEARAEAGETCERDVAPKRLSRELTRPAGAEHVAGRLRWPSNARASSVSRIKQGRS